MGVNGFECGAGGGGATAGCFRTLPVTQLRLQPVECFRTERHDLHVAVQVYAGLAAAVFLQHDVEIAAAEAERTDTRPPRVRVSRQPRPALGVDVKRRRVGRQYLEGLRYLDRGR